MINTIKDLENHSPEEIENVRSGIDLRAYMYLGLREMGTKEGLTMTQYEEWQAKEPDKECKACDGTGVFKVPERSVGCIHASSAHACVRRLYYDVVADKAPRSNIPPRLMFTFQMGHAIHDVVQKALHISLKNSFEDEVRVDLVEAFVLNSRTDGVAILPNARVLLEIKSIGKEFDKLTEPKPEHLIQAMGIYATALEVPFVSFLYVSKLWPHEVKEFVVPYDPKIYRRWWRTKGSVVEKALQEGEPPIADANKYECSDCAYNYFCEQRAR